MTYYVPKKMQSSRCWVLWKLELDKNSRMTKVPYQINGYKASSTDSSTWTTYEDAFSALHSVPSVFNGIGFVITKASKIIFIDIDHCIDEDGNMNETAQDILSAFAGKTFVEVSQSGSGLHILTLGEIPRSFKNSKEGVEMYADGRYIAFVGNSIVPKDIEPYPEAIAYVFEKYKTQTIEKKSLNELRQASPVDVINGDAEIVARASLHGKFSLLYRGEYERAGYGSQSEADIALCIPLAYWSNRNPDTIDRIFRTSGLYREKWEREDYRSSTIAKACALVPETISEWKARRKNELNECQLRGW